MNLYSPYPFVKEYAQTDVATEEMGKYEKKRGIDIYSTISYVRIDASGNFARLKKSFEIMLFLRWAPFPLVFMPHGDMISNILTIPTTGNFFTKSSDQPGELQSLHKQSF